MGLRIIAYTGVVPRESLSPEDLEQTPEECFLELSNPRGYESRLAPFQPGLYVYRRHAMHEDIGGYGYYSGWRDWMSRSFVGVPAAEVDGRHAGMPFYELVDFTDSSGFLGPDAVEELSWNFDGWEHELDQHLAKVESPDFRASYEETYRQFQRCLLHLREYPGPGSSVLQFG